MIALHYHFGEGTGGEVPVLEEFTCAWREAQRQGFHRADKMGSEVREGTRQRLQATEKRQAAGKARGETIHAEA